jgi:hypothetical protein
MSEILKLEWAWVDLDNRRVAWPDSKTCGMSKPMSAEAVRLLETAPRLEKSPYVCPSIFDPNRPMSKHTYSKGWRRILGRAGLKHIGTHGIRHRSATDIANPGIPVKVGMALTAHKTVTMFMRYVHTEDDPVRAAADALASRRLGLIGGAVAVPATKSVPAPIIALETVPELTAEADKPLGFEDGNYRSRTKLANYRPFRHRGGANRAVPLVLSGPQMRRRSRPMPDRSGPRLGGRGASRTRCLVMTHEPVRREHPPTSFGLRARRKLVEFHRSTHLRHPDWPHIRGGNGSPVQILRRATTSNCSVKRVPSSRPDPGAQSSQWRSETLARRHRDDARDQGRRRGAGHRHPRSLGDRPQGPLQLQELGTDLTSHFALRMRTYLVNRFHCQMC